MTHYQSLTPNIGVENVNDTVKFYKDYLGFELIMSVPEEGNMAWAMMISGNACIMLQEKNNLMEEYPQLEMGGRNGCLTFFIRVKGIDNLYEKMSRTDYMVKELHAAPYAEKEFAIRDNNGHIFTIVEDND